jgi:hypothetical protein
MIGKDPEKERWVFYFHRDINKLLDIVRDYMTDYNAEYEIDGMKEGYLGQIGDMIQWLTYGVLDDLRQLSGNGDYDEETNRSKHAFEIITRILEKEFPCLGKESWNDEMCKEANCRIKSRCYTTRSFNKLHPLQKREWVLDQIKVGIQTFDG